MHAAVVPSSRRRSMPVGCRCGASRVSITVWMLPPSVWSSSDAIAVAGHAARAVSNRGLELVAAQASATAGALVPSRSLRRAAASSSPFQTCLAASALKIASASAISSNELAASIMTREQRSGRRRRERR
eukprot:1284509-Prymnesium_polylepis.1